MKSARLVELSAQLGRIERLAAEARAAIDVGDAATVALRFTELQDSAVPQAARMLDAAGDEAELCAAVEVAEACDGGRFDKPTKARLCSACAGRLADAVAAYEEVLPNDPLVLQGKKLLLGDKGGAS
mgnify:CR=1 FL=1